MVMYRGTFAQLREERVRQVDELEAQLDALRFTADDGWRRAEQRALRGDLLIGALALAPLTAVCIAWGLANQRALDAWMAECTKTRTEAACETEWMLRDRAHPVGPVILPVPMPIVRPVVR